ncbi:LPXTG cell wall anchor domain-containing protein [Arthrobacter sp. SA17]
MYWLEETVAPDGFSLLAEPVQFTVGADGVITLGQGEGGGVVTTADVDADGIFLITVRDVPALKMPETGGTGHWPFAFAGSALLLVAFVLSSGSIRRRRNQ